MYSQCEVCGGPSATGTGTSLRTSICPYQYNSNYEYIFNLLLLPEGQAGETWKHVSKAVLFRISRSILQKTTFTWISFFKVLIEFPFSPYVHIRYNTLHLECKNGIVEGCGYIISVLLQLNIIHRSIYKQSSKKKKQ
jgi:hypothetical protein